MEASSLLVAPKPPMPVTVPFFFFSARGFSNRGSLVVSTAAANGKDLETRPERSSNGVHHVSKALMTRARGGAGLFVAAAAAATSGALVTLQCCGLASAATLERPSGELSMYCRAVAVLGDLDPATAKAVAGVAGPALSALEFLFILRIVMSWYPKLLVTRFPYVLAYAPTEPFLAVTRKVIPPLGGVDVTPVVWFGLVSFLSEILVGPQGLLVLLSQQKP